MNIKQLILMEAFDLTDKPNPDRWVAEDPKIKKYQDMLKDILNTDKPMFKFKYQVFADPSNSLCIKITNKDKTFTIKNVDHMSKEQISYKIGKKLSE